MTGSLAPPKLCVLDLDGTLVDSLRDIGESLNEALELLGLPPHPIDGYRYMVGEGYPTLCQRAIGRTHPHLVARLVELGSPRYRTRPLRHTRPYPGVREAVAALGARGIRLAVLSNKPHDMTVHIVDGLWPAETFLAVQGYVEEPFRKPDPRHLLELCRRAGAAPGECWMVGDTPTDVATARAAGCVSVAVTWGFRMAEDLAAARPDALLGMPSALPDLLIGRSRCAIGQPSSLTGL